jgi:catechol 2,3-dioxygenase-like lactoylglutathione lyase family enzyme
MKLNQFSNSLFILLSAAIMACTSTETRQEEATENPAATTVKTLNDYGIRATNVFLYYEDLAAAADFYTQVLGLEQVADYGMARILRVAGDSYFILVDATKGMHSAEEPKTVAIALITDQLDAWYDYLVGEGYTMKYEYKPKAGSAHDGFVMADPEGYLLEFERFNAHEENKAFTPLLAGAKTITNPNREGVKTPEGLGFKASVTWMYYKDMLAMQEFYEKKLGLEFIVDQGWAKVLKVSATGYIGLVDEKKGMHSFTQDKAVTVAFFIDDLDGWFTYVKANALFTLRADSIGSGPEGKYRAFVGYDPEGYFLEFDTFYPHKDNTLLLKYK